MLRRMSVQLVALLTLAILPLGLISVYQSRAVLNEAEELNRAALLAETEAAATSERELIYEALGAAQGLSVLRLEASWDDCRAVLAEFVTHHPRFSFAGFATPGGNVVCAARGPANEIAGSAAMSRIVESEGPHIELMSRADKDDPSMVLVADAARRGNRIVGHVLISIPSSLADALLSEQATEMGLRLATINAQGQVIAATGGPEAAGGFLPAGIGARDLFDRDGQTFRAQTVSGAQRVFAVSEIVPGSAAIVGSWPTEIASASILDRRARIWVAFPLLMWLAGMAVAVFGLHRLAIRHVSALSRAMTQHADGQLTSGRIELDNPPVELEAAETAFNRMLLLLAEANARQEQDLRDKEVLLREVHHRVKNNLQLIASIMNMQARVTKSGEAQRILQDLQRRVRGLALLHRRLYTKPDTSTVDGAELIRTLLDEILQTAPGPALKIETRLDPVELYPDQAMPLSMLFSEAVTNAVKYVGRPENGPARIVIDLTAQKDSMVRFRVANTLGDPVFPAGELDSTGGGLGTKLMRAFVSQLEGRAEQGEANGMYCYDVSFRRLVFASDNIDPAQARPSEG